MAACRYLEGENIDPRNAKEARALIGRRVCYLTNYDIDRNRGIFFPRYGTIADVRYKEIALNEAYNFCLRIGDLAEMILVEKKDA